MLFRSVPKTPAIITDVTVSPDSGLVCAVNPASGIINSDGIGGKIFSANISIAIPKFPALAIVVSIQFLSSSVMMTLIIQINDQCKIATDPEGLEPSTDRLEGGCSIH